MDVHILNNLIKAAARAKEERDQSARLNRDLMPFDYAKIMWMGAAINLAEYILENREEFEAL